MWQAPSQRMRAVSNQKKRERDRSRRPMHIKRVHAEIKLVNPRAAQGEAAVLVDARLLLNDLSPKGMGVFSAQAMDAGQEIAITLQDPSRIYLRGKVIHCQEFDANSHVLSAKSFSYRIGIQFLFETADEQAAVKKFCEQISREHIFKAA